MAKWTKEADGDWCFNWHNGRIQISGLACCHQNDGKILLLMQGGHEMGRYATIEEAKALCESFARDRESMIALYYDVSPTVDALIGMTAV